MPPEIIPGSNTGRTVSLTDDTVVKVQEPGASRRERLRTLAAREVGQRTGLFVVPEIVSFDDSRGEIVFKRLRLIGLRQALSERNQSLDLVGRAGVVLAAIHREMKSGEFCDEIDLSEMAINQRRASVPLHGDFGMRNICCLPGSNDIAIIDWANADWIGVDGDRGPPEIDIAVFLVSFFHRRPFGPWPVSGRHALAQAFLEAYAAGSPYALDLDVLKTIVAAIAPEHLRMTVRLKGRLRALAYSYNSFDLDFFLRRLSGKVFPRRDRPRG